MASHPIIACSDASVDSAKFSTFSWIIYGHTALWQGDGIVPGLVEDIYSGRSEAFGLLTTLQFLSHYLAHFPNMFIQIPTITMYCDNKGVLDRIDRMQHAGLIYPQQTTEDDFDVYHKIIQILKHIQPTMVSFCHIKEILKHIQPTMVTFCHIKGHQDKTKQKREHLSLPA